MRLLTLAVAAMVVFLLIFGFFGDGFSDWISSIFFCCPLVMASWSGLEPANNSLAS